MPARPIIAVLLITSSASAHALRIDVPDSIENGAVIPVAVNFDRPLVAGQQLELTVNGQSAAQVRAVEGKLSTFSTRIKGSRSNTTIAARVRANGNELDRAARDVKVSVPASVSGSPTAAGTMKVMNSGGSVKLLMVSENGFAGMLVLQGPGFHAEITGSTSLAKNPFIAVTGDFPGQVTASIGGRTQQAAVPQQPSPSSAPAAQALSTTSAGSPAPQGSARSASEPTAAERIRTDFDKRIAAARAECTASKDSCDTGCAGVAAIGVLAVLGNKRNGASEASTQLQQCTDRCENAKSNCDQQVRMLEQEKSQAIADAANAQTKATYQPNTAPQSALPSEPTSNRIPSVLACEAEFRRFAEFEATQFSNPRYMGLTRDAIERFGNDTLQQSFQGWTPFAPNRRPFEQMFSDPAMLRLYAKDKIESETDPRFRVLAAFQSCLALRRADALSGKPASVGTKGPSPDSPAGERFAACTNEIKTKQRESQQWTGDSRDNAARLGRYQKELFEGRCAGHPEAQAYIASANKMLSYGGNLSGSPSKLSVGEIKSCDLQLEQMRKQIMAGSDSEQIKRLALGGMQETLFSSTYCRDHPNAQALLNEARVLKGGGGKTSPNESIDHNPLHDASNCIRFSGPDEMKARGLHGVLPSRIDNICNFPIEVRWCVEAGNGRRGDCNPGYSNAITLAPPGGRGTSSYGVDAVNQNVRMAACKKGERWGFQLLKTDPRKPFDYACK